VDTIRVCIGTERRTMVPCRVLEYSILKHVAKGTKVEFHHLMGGDWQDYGPGEQYTGFSFLRWTIPQKFHGRGKAIYLDSDQLCLADISELWNSDRTIPNPEACLWCTYYDHKDRKFFGLLKTKKRLSETSVMLIDCAKAGGRLMTPEQIQEYIRDDVDKKKYREVMHATYLKPPPQEISRWWNLMDGRGHATEDFTSPQARLLHFTQVATQPWYDAEHPKRGVWESYFREALDSGYIGQADIKEACGRFSIERARPDGMHPYWKRYAA
jgi:lipopolysaccharide biosynthesis glycosyltransferase